VSQARILPDLIDRPAAAMRAIVERPKSWWWAAGLLVIVLVAHTAVTAPYYAEIASEAQAAMLERVGAQLSEEQLEAVQARVARSQARSGVAQSAVMAVVAAFIGWLLWAVGASLGGLFAGGRGQFPAMWAVTVWSQLPRAVGYLVTMAYTWIHQAVPAHEGLGYLVASGGTLANASDPAYIVLSAVTPAALWSLLLLIVGTRIALNLSRTAATMVVIILWAIALALRLVPAMLLPGMVG
jgi:hypothetical protein